MSAGLRDGGVGASTSGARVVRVVDEHLDALVAFYRRVWDPDAVVPAVRQAREREAAENPIVPGEPVPTFLFMAGDEAVGHLGTIPVRLWCAAGERAAHWLRGLWVLPEHRNGPIGFLLVREAIRQLEVAMSVVVEPAPRRLFEAQGFRDYGRIPNFLRLLRPGRVLDRLEVARTGLVSIPEWLARATTAAQRLGGGRLAGAAIAAGTSLWTAGRGSRGLVVERDVEIDVDEASALWHRMRGGLSAAPSRGGDVLKARYRIGDGSPYSNVAVRSGDELAGLAVLRAPGPSPDARLAGIDLAVCSELLYPLGKPKVGLATAAAVEEQARDLGADALLFTASHASVRPLLRRRAFVPLPGNQHFMIRDGLERDDYPEALGGWWLTRGDSKGDGAF